VVNVKTSRAIGSVKVFTPDGEIQNIFSAMVVRLFQFLMVGLVLRIIVWIRELLEMASNGRLRFVRFCPDDGLKSFPALPHIGVATEEIYRAGSKAQQLRHDGIVVVLLRNVAIRAVFGGAHAAGGVRKMRIECLA